MALPLEEMGYLWPPRTPRITITTHYSKVTLSRMLGTLESYAIERVFNLTILCKQCMEYKLFITAFNCREPMT